MNGWLLKVRRVLRIRSRWREWSRRVRDGILAWNLGEVTIVVVSYNGLELVRQCLESILADPSYPRYQVVVVDNASEEPVRAYLRHLQETERRVRVIFNETNLGFAAANNIGLRQLDDSEFVVLLNNDTVVPPGWLGRLLRHARKPDVGIVGPVTNWTGNEARIPVTYSDLFGMPAFAEAYTRAHRGQVFDITTLAMYCVAMRRAVFEQIGPLDERFGQGLFEDVDYARRIKQAGYRVICAEDAFVHHHGRASFSKLPPVEYDALFERNRRLYEEKWGEPWIPHRWRSGTRQSTGRATVAHGLEA
jgi:GT2 family glycosyltransferase